MGSPTAKDLAAAVLAYQQAVSTNIFTMSPEEREADKAKVSAAYAAMLAAAKAVQEGE